jgi:hypothetical protein
MNPIFQFKELRVELLKQFDGTTNYFNCAHFNGKTIYRRETKLNDEFHVHDIVDQDNNVILQNYADDEYHYNFEDARWIDDKTISVCVSKWDVKDLSKLCGVSFKKYDLETKRLYHFLTQRSHFEKHWQFQNNYIIYHINPYTIFDSNEQEVFSKKINWKPWIDKFGSPGLSTNVFDVYGEKFLLYHSYVYQGPTNMKYFVGIMKLNNDLTPFGYCVNPFLVADREYSSNYVLNSVWNWRGTESRKAIKYEVLFPMSVSVDDTAIHIYGGLNDCSSVKMSVDKIELINRLRQQPFIVY